MSRAPTALLALTVMPLLATGTASAALFGPLDFETSGQYSDNFHVFFTASGSTSGQTDTADVGEPNNDYLRIYTTGGNNATTTIMINQSTDTKTTANSTRFGNSFTMNFDLSTNQTDSNLYLVLFDPSSPANNLAFRIKTPNTSSSTANESITFRRDVNMTITAGTTGTGITSGVTANAGTLTAASTIQYDGDFLAYTTEADATAGNGFTSASLSYNLNPGVNDGGTFSVTLGSLTATLTLPDDDHVIDNPAIAFYNMTYSNTNNGWRIDNLEIVPEPAMLGLLPLAALFAGRRRRAC